MPGRLRAPFFSTLPGVPPPDDPAVPPARVPRRPLGRGPGDPARAVPETEDGGAPAAPGPEEELPDGAQTAPVAGTSEAGEPAREPGPGEDLEPGREGKSGEDSEPGETPESVQDPDSVQDSQQEPGDGRFTIRLDNFEGPFDLLLQLISRHRMDVTEVALSRVTDEFMVHIRAMGPEGDLDQTTEFLVVAATLLDLKAARLLPAAEVEDEADLALLEARDLLFARLLQYRAYKEIAEVFAGRMAEEDRRYPRTVGLEPHHAELLPDVVLSIGPEGFAALAAKAMQPRPEPQVLTGHIHAPLVSVREQAEVVVARLRELGVVTFQQLAEDAPDTLTVVARFLALLELYRERAVGLDQEEALGALTVRWSGAAGEEKPRVTDEFDRPAGGDGAGGDGKHSRKQEQEQQT